MIFQKLSIPDLILIKPKIFNDKRGFFYEAFQQDMFQENQINIQIKQQNFAGSAKGVLRGLHYQICHPQGKFIQVVSGEIFDVAVDIRKSSKTFKQWVGVFLDSVTRNGLWIPPGFAHGYYVLSDWAEITYLTSEVYNSSCERSILWNDPDLKIDWPIIKNKNLELSDKDKNGVLIKNAELFN